MLEQLAREHQLPLNEDSGLPYPMTKVTSAIPADKPRSDSTPRSGFNTAVEPINSTRLGAQIRRGVRAGQPAGDGQPHRRTRPITQIPAYPLATRCRRIPKEYRELFDKLKQFEQQKRRSLESKAPWQPEGDTAQPGDRTSRKDPARGNAGANANPRNGNATNGGNQQRPPIRRREDPLSSSSTTKPVSQPVRHLLRITFAIRRTMPTDAMTRCFRISNRQKTGSHPPAPGVQTMTSSTNDSLGLRLLTRQSRQWKTCQLTAM